MGKAIFITGVLVGVVFYGPFFGLLLGGAFSLLPTIITTVLWRWARRSGRVDRRSQRAALLTASVVVWGTVMYFLLRPFSGEVLIDQHLHLTREHVSDVRRWADQWGIDPVYGVRFTVKETALRTALPTLQRADSQPRPSVFWTAFGGRRSWWVPEQIREPLNWSDESGNPHLLVQYDPQSETAYLLIVYF